ncbi:hypothetical protein L226DRAFT_274222 [Lentinus tigrinus ALCF2SS1-7]|uniref:uncharacterized protein n=1 Tax=Lentinus tigrinus ALCF2SS1-7 TaxID=1328758 RepID=UPI0011660A0C|nr:hypothetical protein L226DRAFT_274222 [Lentinus tigrinus ALCF2SS1-7]
MGRGATCKKKKFTAPRGRRNRPVVVSVLIFARLGARRTWRSKSGRSVDRPGNPKGVVQERETNRLAPRCHDQGRSSQSRWRRVCLLCCPRRAGAIAYPRLTCGHERCPRLALREHKGHQDTRTPGQGHPARICLRPRICREESRTKLGRSDHHGSRQAHPEPEHCYTRPPPAHWAPAPSRRALTGTLRA